ncbi:hypothetical protein [Acetivibrio ethanolgignens]|uniref:Uncharacterized protein n=1 Tax=Acetivibrio ethanolgignens TaxID=290052 RepID=A0A0V8QHU5_9FIRM|nr:hypothetical protein [Acetivibrio ethanolgignens]KSV60076.1 hypothetical protein ASU35_06625 [Acetivibrio ethanolgignens]
MKNVTMQETTEMFFYHEQSFSVMMIEKGELFCPWELGLLSQKQNKEELFIRGSYQIEDFVLYLEGFEAYSKQKELIIKKEDLHIPLSYNGSVLLVRELLERYAEYKPLYGYKKLMELIFDHGKLITAIDHSRAMYRIRRNLEAGLRDMANPKDARCILSFIDDLFVGKYKESIRTRYFQAIKRAMGKAWRRLGKKDES